MAAMSPLIATGLAAPKLERARTVAARKLLKSMLMVVWVEVWKWKEGGSEKNVVE